MDHHLILDNREAPSLVIYGQDRCGACRHVCNLLSSDNWLTVRFPGLMVFSVDVSLGTWLSKELDIFHLPELLLYEHGEITARIHCQLNKESLEESIAIALTMEQK